MTDQAPEPKGSTIEAFVLAHWDHFHNVVGWKGANLAIKSYEKDPQAFRRERFALERLQAANAERERLLGGRGPQDTRAEDGAQEVISEIRLLAEKGLSEEEIAEATHYVLRGVRNALRIIRGQKPLHDPHIGDLADKIGRFGEDDVR